MADVDGDNKMEFVQFAKNKVFSFEADFDHSARLRYYTRRNFKDMLVGNFREAGHSVGRDEICLISTDNKLDCYTVSPDGKTLWWWFYQPNFISDGEQVIVADYDNDGVEDIAVYNAEEGKIKFYSIKSGGAFFGEMDISQGNLTNRVNSGGRVYSGNFSGDGASDLLFINSSGQAMGFQSSISSDRRTFWWGFTTVSQFGSDDQISISNLDGTEFDSVVKRDAESGKYTFYQMKYDGGNLKLLTSVNVGQLPEMPAVESIAYFGELATFGSDEGNARDDLILYLKTNNQVWKYDARYDASNEAKTYWWHYRRGSSQMNSGWNDRKSYKVAVVKCLRQEDSSDDLRSDTYIREFFDRDQELSMNDYFMDISMGRIDLENIDIFGTYSVTLKGNDRAARINECVNNIGSAKNNYDKVIAHTSSDEYGASGDTLLMLSKGSFIGSTGGHEILHIFGLPHSRGETQKKLSGCSWCAAGVYQNKYDIMSANNIHTFTTASFGKAGPNLMPFFQMNELDTLPSHKYLKSINSDGSQKKSTIKLTSVSRPESPNYIAGDFTTYKGVRYTVELRTKEGWDAGIPEQGIIINRIGGSQPNAIWTSDDSKVLVLDQVNEAWENSNNGIKVVLKSINTSRGIAEVDVHY